jgi:hypothetical protein
MAQALDTLEALLVYSGGGLPGRTDKAPSERHGLRYLMEVTLGQFVGVLVAIWCILRSIDSVFEVPGQPAYPGAGSGGYVPGAAERAVKPGMEASGPGAAVAMGARRRGSVSSNGSSAAAKPADELPGSAAFACKVVNIRSKRSLQTIARLSRSGSEVRRRLIEFSFQTRAWPLAAHSSDKNAANVAASPLPVPQGAVVGVVARRQGECEELLRLVVRGAIPADASAKLASKRLLDPPQESSAAGGAAEQAAAAWEATRPPGSSSRSSGGGAAGLSAAEPISPASLIHKAPQPEPAGTPPSLGQREGLATPGGIAPARAARKSYLGFTSSGRTDAAAGPAGGSGGSNSSAGSGVGGGLDLSAEMAFVTGAEVRAENFLYLFPLESGSAAHALFQPFVLPLVYLLFFLIFISDRFNASPRARALPLFPVRFSQRYLSPRTGGSQRPSRRRSPTRQASPPEPLQLPQSPAGRFGLGFASCDCRGG